MTPSPDFGRGKFAKIVLSARSYIGCHWPLKILEAKKHTFSKFVDAIFVRLNFTLQLIYLKAREGIELDVSTTPTMRQNYLSLQVIFLY